LATILYWTGAGGAIGGPVGFLTALFLRAGGKKRLRWDESTVEISPFSFFGYGAAIGATMAFVFGVILTI
jgi:hypothetical protein